jgi:predicted amidophosphoribosyltransferase
MSGARFCPECGEALKPEGKFCPSCGKPVRQETPAAAPVPQAAQSASPIGAKRVMTRRARFVYAALTILLFALFLFTFARHLPGGANPVIAAQQEVETGYTKPDQVITPAPVEAEVRDGKISFPLSLLLEKRMVGFEYRSDVATVPMIAFITGEGKLVTAVAICEPCNSHTFRIEGTEIACGNCETRWKLNNLEGIQGSCQKYPPAPIPSTVVGNRVQIDEQLVKNWKMRI